MELRGGGFTIVELVIAVSVTAILLAAVLPRYTTFSRQQDLDNEAVGITGCLQKAQQLAVAPPIQDPPVRYVGAILRQNSTKLSCESVLFYQDPSSPTLPTLLSDDTATVDKFSIGQEVTSSAAQITALSQPVSIVPPSSTPFKSIRVYFGTLEHGLPVGMACTGPAACPTSTYTTLQYPSGWPQGVQYGDGFPLQLTLVSTSDPTLTGTITMGQLGMPIHYQGHQGEE